MAVSSPASSHCLASVNICQTNKQLAHCVFPECQLLSSPNALPATPALLMGPTPLWYILYAPHAATKVGAFTSRLSDSPNCQGTSPWPPWLLILYFDILLDDQREWLLV
uniref:Ephexin-1 n=1 Tax=Zeugodacus cucurbitae TaxID=28588 RepID=A0A0A1X6Q0_ZEUCU